MSQIQINLKLHFGIVSSIRLWSLLQGRSRLNPEIQNQNCLTTQSTLALFFLHLQIEEKLSRPEKQLFILELFYFSPYKIIPKLLSNIYQTFECT